MSVPTTQDDLKSLRLRLEAAVRRRESLLQTRQRLLGRLEEAERAAEALRAQCRAKNIDPDNLDGVIAQLETALNQSVTELETKLNDVEHALDPFTNGK